MKLSTFLLLNTASAAAILSRGQTETWSVTGFSATSNGPNSKLDYQLSLSSSSGASITCSASNRVPDDNCDKAPRPAPFAETCSDMYWGWKLSEANSPTSPPTSGFSLEIIQNGIDGGETMHGCRFLSNETFCQARPGNPEGPVTVYWEIPTNFTMYPTAGDGGCVYA